VRGRRTNAWLWIEHAGRVWLQQRPAVGVWAGLWTLPSFDDAAALQAFARPLGLVTEALPVIDHALTHFDWRLLPHRALPSSADQASASSAALGDGRWVAIEDLPNFALPAPLRRLLDEAAVAPT
jgi:A/G-specific adenine glycosylase